MFLLGQCGKFSRMNHIDCPSDPMIYLQGSSIYVKAQLGLTISSAAIDYPRPKHRLVIG